MSDITEEEKFKRFCLEFQQVYRAIQERLVMEHPDWELHSEQFWREHHKRIKTHFGITDKDIEKVSENIIWSKTS